MNPDAINTGGPAFPQPATDEGHAANTPYGIAGGGMDLRDYFAAKAMQAIFTNQGTNSTSGGDEDDARIAYRMADAMLKVRGEA